MPIIIPSKKIHNVSNFKGADNAIKNFEIEENSLSYESKTNSLNLESEKLVFTDQTFGNNFKTSQISDTPRYRFTSGLYSEATSCVSTIELDRKGKDYYITDLDPKLEAVYEVTISSCEVVSRPGATPNQSDRFSFDNSETSIRYNRKKEEYNNYTIDISDFDDDFEKNLQFETNIAINDEGITVDFYVTNIGDDYTGIIPEGSGKTINFFVQALGSSDRETYFTADGTTWNQYIFSRYNTDYANNAFSTDTYDGKAVVKYKGLILLRDVPWEMLSVPVTTTEKIIETEEYLYNDNFAEPNDETFPITSGPISGIRLHISPDDISSFSSFPYFVGIPEPTEESFTLNVYATSNLTLFVAQDCLEIERKNEEIVRPIKGKVIIVKLKEAKIVYNETIRQISSQKKTETLNNLASKGEQTFSIKSNPFIRAQNKYSEEYAATALYWKTLNSYMNGKEIATISCSIGEYFDDEGNLVISTKTPDKMVFEIYDRVVPMIRDGYGRDVPMSYNGSNQAKVFEIVGISNRYDGSLVQELTLRECGAITLD